MRSGHAGHNHRPSTMNAPARRTDVILIGLLRLVTAGLAGATAGIHLRLYTADGYQSIPTIGKLFLFNGIAGSLLAVLLLVAPRRVLPLAAAATALFLASTIGGLILAVNVGLFGFTEMTSAPFFNQALGVEVAGVLSAALLAGLARPSS